MTRIADWYTQRWAAQTWLRVWPNIVFIAAHAFAVIVAALAFPSIGWWRLLAVLIAVHSMFWAGVHARAAQAYGHPWKTRDNEFADRESNGLFDLDRAGLARRA